MDGDGPQDWRSVCTDRRISKTVEQLSRSDYQAIADYFRADIASYEVQVDDFPTSHVNMGTHSIRDHSATDPVTQNTQNCQSLLIKDDTSVNSKDMMEFLGICQSLGKGRPLFSSHFSIGFASVGFWLERFEPDYLLIRPNLVVGDEIFAVDGVPVLLILRKICDLQYIIVGECYLWSALQLDCWHPGTKKGRWGPGVERPTGTQTRMIEIV
jgi:hypothetical protein